MAYKARTVKMLREANVMTARYKAAAQRNAEADAKATAEMDALRAVAAAAAVERDESRLALEKAEEEIAAVRCEGAGAREALSRVSADLEVGKRVTLEWFEWSRGWKGKGLEICVLSV